MQRKNIRLRNYDYSQAGLYFVTICLNERECLFGEIIQNKQVLNDIGLMIKGYYHELEKKFSGVKCGEYVIMPNHFHCIIHIENDCCNFYDVGVDLCVNPTKKGEHIGAPLHKIVQWFKTMTTNEYIKGVKTKNWKPFNKRLWQRNYYEHVIRNEKSYIEICEYIQNNPLKWDLDELNPNN